MMRLICLYTVPPAEMRYAAVADWHYPHRGLDIRVPRGMSDDETLLAMAHELVEAYAARKAGITDYDASRWDMALWTLRGTDPQHLTFPQITGSGT